MWRQVLRGWEGEEVVEEQGTLMEDELGRESIWQQEEMEDDLGWNFIWQEQGEMEGDLGWKLIWQVQEVEIEDWVE